MFLTSSWRQICFYYSAVLVITYFLVFADDAERGELTLCGRQSKNPRSLIFVSTLDGKVSALDINNHGQKQWTLDFKDGPLLSSSIHRAEVVHNGQWIRLIPSLSGGLYKFNGETLDTVPISTDQLLHSSFRYSDDLVCSGGKKLHSYGVSTNTGTILYECGVDGCKNDTDYEEHLEQEVLIIQRFQKTVRAVEARTGVERWNFSVGQHDLMLIPATDLYCSNKVRNLDIEIKAIIPEGLIWAINKNNPDVKLWEYKFDYPIVTIWRENMSKRSINPESTLQQIDLFDGSQWHWGLNHPRISPDLYLGMHERQLYVQENFNFKNLVDALPTNIEFKRYPWHPHPAVATALTTSLPDNGNNNEMSTETNKIRSTALAVLYNSDYIDGNGFYLYSKDQLSENMQCNGSDFDIMLITEMEKPVLTYTEEEDDTPVQVIMVSLWYWWKEVLIISVTTAILLNFMLSQRLLNVTTNTKNAVLPPLVVERHIEVKGNDLNNDAGRDPNNFNSRYLTDFEPVDCLGKGGYGVVFEAKNKIDDCNYAIKRIALPNSRDSRERVMREVKALAKLDHQNIVRYFNAWLECPPKGWQEEHDQQWIAKLKLSSSGFPSGTTHTTTKPNGSVYIDVSQTDPSSADSAREAIELNNVETNDDSFVVFERSTDNQYDNDAICINACSTDSSDVSFSNNKTEKELSNMDNTNHSESIVFEGTNDDDADNDDDDNNTTDRKGKRSHQRSLSLDLRSKSSEHRSTKMFLYIQMQLCQRLSLREWLKQHTSARDPPWVLNIFQQIIDAVEYVHLQGLIHRDLKPSNIFFAYDDKVKIGDFGLVTAMTESYSGGAHTPTAEDENVLRNCVHTACVGTHLYMSPEQMNCQIYNYKVDIYSLGIIFFELLTPFFTDMERIMELLNLKKSSFPKDFATNYPAEYDLLKMMLDQDPAKRPTTLGIKARPPLQNYEIANGFNIDQDSKWHFELPQMTRQFSVTSSSSSNESRENIMS